MSLPKWLRFLERPFPSANMVLIATERPVLIDTGFGSDLARTEQLLRVAGVLPEEVTLVVNTHYHCDHVGGNSGLQRRYGIPIAAHHLEADHVNRRTKEACDAEWLDQPIEPYVVDQLLSDGDEINAGGVCIQVLHTPFHSPGHLCFYLPDEKILIAGDTVHGNDVAWLNPFREGVDAFEVALETVDRLARLPVRWACSGHGPAITDPPAAFERARRRYQRWSQTPQKMGWHASKRIFAYALMIEHGLTQEELYPYLLQSPWFQDYSQRIFKVEPVDFIEPLLAEMLRSQAAAWKDGRLIALAPHNPPPKGWAQTQLKPKDWPPCHPERSEGSRF